MEGIHEYETMMDTQYDLTAAINAHNDLFETNTGDSLSEEQFKSLTIFQQKIINLSYKLKEATEAYRRTLKVNKQHINEAAGSLNPRLKTYAQRAIAQPVLKGSENAPEEQIKTDSSNWDSSATQQYPKLPLPVLQSNVILQPNGNIGNVKFPEGKQTFFIIKVPPNSGGPLNFIPVQHNNTQGSCNAVPLNGILVNNLPVNNNTISVDNNDSPSSLKVVSVPSPLITHTVAVEATKGLQLNVSPPTDPPSAKWPKLDDEEDEEQRIASLAKKQAWFLSLFDLCNQERLVELSQKRGERRRRRLVRSTFSTANVEERRRTDLVRKKRKVVVPGGKTKLEFKEELELKSQRLKEETKKLLKRKEEAQRDLAAERLRRSQLEERQRAMEDVIVKMRNICSFMEGSKMFACKPPPVAAPELH